jgi:hypothetical protein
MAISKKIGKNLVFCEFFSCQNLARNLEIFKNLPNAILNPSR